MLVPAARPHVLASVLLLAIAPATAFAQAPARFLIEEGGRYGYVDARGEVVVPPRYLAGGAFSEGLAPVRVAGCYGYIGVDGAMAIPPRFDYAEPFGDGVARAYLAGRPYLIDADGEVLFEHPYAELERPDEDGYCVVETESGLKGIVDASGQLTLAPLYERFDEIVGDHVLVRRAGPAGATGWAGRYQTAVLTREGAIVVPFGRYSGISLLGDDMAFVDYWPERDSQAFAGLIDLTDVDLRLRPSTGWTDAYGDERRFSGGLAVVNISGEEYRRVAMGYIDAEARLVSANADWEELSPMAAGRAFAKTDTGWELLDARAQPIARGRSGLDAYSDVAAAARSLAELGTFVARADGRVMRYDRDGQPKGELKAVPPGASISVRGAYLVYGVEAEGGADDFGWSKKYGAIRLRDGVATERRFDQIFVLPDTDTGTGVLGVREDGRYGYVDARGDYRWRQAPADTAALPRPLDIDHMNRGYYYAGAPRVKSLDGYGGWGGSDNGYRPLPAEARPHYGDSLGFSIDTASATVSHGGASARFVYLANASSDTAFFGAQDSRLPAVVEARDDTGAWRPIEYLPSSWCGNSYHTLHLPPGQYWGFRVPDYAGADTTEMRLTVTYSTVAGHEGGERRAVYSATWVGGVNPGQFWRKPAYFARGIMDPYVD